MARLAKNDIVSIDDLATADIERIFELADSFAAGLERGETVKLSSFGSFVVRKKGQRIGRNPKTGKEVPISPRRVMVFKPSAILKQQINAEPTQPEAAGQQSQSSAR